MDNLPDIPNDLLSEALWDACYDPFGFRAVMRLDRWIREGRVRLSRVNLRRHRERLKAHLNASTGKKPGRKGGVTAKRHAADWKRSEEVYKKGGEAILRYLKYRFDNNKKHGKTKGEWKLTATDLDVIFNTRLVSGVTVSEYGNSTLLRRIDPEGDFEMGNVQLIKRRRRPRVRVGLKGRRRFLNKGGVIFCGRKYVKKMERLAKFVVSDL